METPITTTLTSTRSLIEQRSGGGRRMPLVLPNHPAQGFATIDGWKSVFFGLPFLLAGVGIEFAALNLFHGHKNGPDWLIGLVGRSSFPPALFWSFMACAERLAERSTSANLRRGPASLGSLTIIGSAKASRFR